MGPRVNITYTIEIEELEGETERLLARALTKLEKIRQHETSDTFQKNLLSLESVDEVVTIRNELAAVDFMLQDIERLISGYLHYKTSPPSPEREGELPLEESQSPPRVPDELQQKLEQFAGPLTPS